VASRQRALLHSAYLACGNRQTAEDLLQEALAKTAMRWGPGSATATPTPTCDASSTATWSPRGAAGGNTAGSVGSGSLSPDGTRLALPVRDAVVVVDLPAGRVSRWPVSGFNEEVVWSTTGRQVLVGRDEGWVALDPDDGTTSTAPGDLAYATWTDVAARPVGDGWVHLTTGRLDLLDAYGRAELSHPVPEVSEQSSAGYAWWELPVSNFGLVARGAFTSCPACQRLVVLDEDTGAVVAELHVPDGPDAEYFKGAVHPVRWIDKVTVAVSVSGTQGTTLLAWDIHRGALSRLADLPPGYGTVALGDIALG
jgi:hypothetical protein